MTPAIPIGLGDSTISRLRLGRSGLSGQQAGRCGRAQSTHGAVCGVRCCWWVSWMAGHCIINMYICPFSWGLTIIIQWFKAKFSKIIFLSLIFLLGWRWSWQPSMLRRLKMRTKSSCWRPLANSGSPFEYIGDPWWPCFPKWWNLHLRNSVLRPISARDDVLTGLSSERPRSKQATSLICTWRHAKSLRQILLKSVEQDLNQNMRSPAGLGLCKLHANPNTFKMLQITVYKLNPGRLKSAESLANPYKSRTDG